MNTVRTAVLVCVLLAAGRGSALAAGGMPGKWVEVRSDHFIVVSNSGARQARRTAEHFERIRATFIQALPELAEISAPPLRVFAAADERTMKRLLPSFWESRNGRRPAGVFGRRPTGVHIVVRTDYLSENSIKVVYHEYFHYLAHLTRQPIPVWINEGLADYWGNTRLTRDANEIGRPDVEHLEVLRQGYLLPLEELMSVDHASPHYHRSDKVRLLYAQSWALIHYLLLGDDTGERREQLDKCLRLVAEGVDRQEAARRAFGDLNVLESQLRKYVRKLLFPYVKQPATDRAEVDPSAVRDVLPGEIAALAARFLLEGGRRRDAESLVALALEGAPDLPATHEASGLLHIARRKYPQAADAFRQAVELGATGPLAHYGAGVLRFHEDRSPEGLAAVEASLREAVQRRQDFAPAWARLAEVYRRLDATPERALDAIRKARSIERFSYHYQLKEAQILLESGDREGAFRLARDLVVDAAGTDNASYDNSICWDGSLWGLAEAVLPACERAVELDPESSWILDSRAVARALTGDLEGALADLREALRLVEDRWSDEEKSKRLAWVHDLERGVKPFTDATALREDPELAGLGWGQ